MPKVGLLGLNGNIFQTTDSGENWEQISSGFNFRLEKIFFANENNGYILGSGYLLKTIDGGKHGVFCNQQNM